MGVDRECVREDHTEPKRGREAPVRISPTHNQGARRAVPHVGSTRCYAQAVRDRAPAPQRAAQPSIGSRRQCPMPRRGHARSTEGSCSPEPTLPPLATTGPSASRQAHAWPSSPKKPPMHFATAIRQEVQATNAWPIATRTAPTTRSRASRAPPERANWRADQQARERRQPSPPSPIPARGRQQATPDPSDVVAPARVPPRPPTAATLPRGRPPPATRRGQADSRSKPLAEALSTRAGAPALRSLRASRSHRGPYSERISHHPHEHDQHAQRR
jgi:hypothetical protein